MYLEKIKHRKENIIIIDTMFLDMFLQEKEMNLWIRISSLHEAYGSAGALAYHFIRLKYILKKKVGTFY